MAVTGFRIFNDNLIDVNRLANYYVSSENASFPLTNAFNAQRRSKVYRSAGYWNITTSNNVIAFKESSAGSVLYATIQADEYTSIASLGAEIKSQLEIAGGSTYTVTQSNLRWVITSDGAGGTGDFELVWSDSGFTMEDILGITSNKTGALTYTMDTAIIHTEEFITWDMGISQNPECFILIGGNRNENLQISPNATIKLQGNTTNAWSSPQYDQTITYDDDIFSVFSDTGLHTEELRFWRFSVVDQQNPNGYIEVGSFFLGGFLSPTRARANFPLSIEYVDFSTKIYAEGGQQFSDIKEKTTRYSLNIGGQQKADIEAWDTFFLEVGTNTPFFISMDSDEVWSSDKNRRIVFVKFTSAPRHNFSSPDYFTTSLNFEESL